MTEEKHNLIRGALPPACGSRTHTSVLGSRECLDAVQFHHLLAGEASTGGGLLLESAEIGGRSGRGSYLFPSPVLRMILRGETLVVTPLEDRGVALLPLLAERLPGEVSQSDGNLLVKVECPDCDPSLTDRERLLSPSAFDAVRATVTLVEDSGGKSPICIAGAFAYELVDHFEELPPRPGDLEGEPDFNLVLALDGIWWDHQSEQVTVTSRSLTGAGFDGEQQERLARQRLEEWVSHLSDQGHVTREDRSAKVQDLPEFTTDLADDKYLGGVDRFLEHVAAGDIFQGVLSRSLSVTSSADPLDVYRELREGNPSPYMFYFDLGEGVLLGASPETCLTVTGGEALLAPIAGTVPRGLRADGSPDVDLDSRLAVALLLDAKEQAEHAMLIDLARNDLARICLPGTREVEAPLTIERYSHVQHLVTRVRGRLDPALDALDAYRATANMGTLTGAPKLRAMEIIREVEPTGRGWYGGAVGYLTQQGDFDSCIVIRSLCFADGVYTARSGAGIVVDSDPQRELAETLHKAHAPLLAISRAETRLA